MPAKGNRANFTDGLALQFALSGKGLVRSSRLPRSLGVTMRDSGLGVGGVHGVSDPNGSVTNLALVSVIFVLHFGVGANNGGNKLRVTISRVI